jgi:hypothetical protein
MGGGLMQLVAYGAQDVYLTGNPQITFFKVVYRRHTNFSVEPIQQVFNGAADFGRTVTCNLNRNGDLITNMYSVVELRGADSTQAKWGYVRRLGFALVAETKVEIGGSKIDEQYGDWMNIWQELTVKAGQVRGLAKMIGDVPELTYFDASHNPYILYVPLNYWFNRFNGLALPLIALQYHDVRITIQYLDAAKCVNWQAPAPMQLPDSFGMDDSYLLIDYVYLDSEERKRFAQASHEYLIEQLQFTGSESLTTTNNKYRLNFNHPSKYLIWVPHLQKYNVHSQFLTYADDGNWDRALEEAGKLVWLASRNLTLGDGTNAANVDVSGQFYISNPDGTAEDEGHAPTRTTISSSVLVALAAKVDAQAMFKTSGVYVADPENVVLLKNELTAADISIKVDDITGSDVTSRDFFDWPNSYVGPNMPSLLNGAHSVFVYDQFNYGRFLNRTGNPVASGKLQLNGHDRFQERDGQYFNYVQPWQHFSNTPADGINVYSFALKPEDHQPSGTCNFSRIDNATLNVSIVDKNDLDTDSNLSIYTVNYNVLRVMSGMAGTAYSN